MFNGVAGHQPEPWKAENIVGKEEPQSEILISTPNMSFTCSYVTKAIAIEETNLHRVGDQTLVQCSDTLITNSFPEGINHAGIFKGSLTLPFTSDNRSTVFPSHHLHSSADDIEWISNSLANSPCSSTARQPCNNTQFRIFDQPKRHGNYASTSSSTKTQQRSELSILCKIRTYLFQEFDNPFRKGDKYLAIFFMFTGQNLWYYSHAAGNTSSNKRLGYTEKRMACRLNFFSGELRLLGKVHNLLHSRLTRLHLLRSHRKK
nr:hypothetical protein Iba_chr12bCG0420 [Ipomoea batatas]